jgi:Di- and tripeptidases
VSVAAGSAGIPAPTSPAAVERDQGAGTALREAITVAPFRLVSVQGGKSWNAIPRDATAICSLPPEREAGFRAAVESAAEAIKDAHAKTDPGVTVTVTAAAAAGDAWTEDGTRTVLDLIAVVPSGPLAMSPDFGGLVETSTSVGEAVTDGPTLTLHSLSRSSNAAALPEVIAALDAAARLAGGVLEVGQEDPGWQPDLDSPALAACRRVYERSIRRGSDRHRGTRLAGDRRDRRPGSPRPRHGLLRPADRGAALARRAGQHPTVERFWRLLAGVVDEFSAADVEAASPGWHGASAEILCVSSP